MLAKYKDVAIAPNYLCLNKHPKYIILIYHLLVNYLLDFSNSLALLIGITQIFYDIDNYTNLLVSISCFLIDFYQHSILYYQNWVKESSYNDKLINITRNNKNIVVKAKNLLINDLIILGYDDLTPCDIKVTNIIKNGIDTDNKNENDYLLGSYYDRDKSGEDTSSRFRVGDIIQHHKKLTRPGIKIIGKIQSYIRCTYKKGEEIIYPNFLGYSRLVCDIIGLCMVVGLTFINGTLTHLLSFILLLNIFVPSMRMNLLYNMFMVSLDLLFNNISFKNASIINRFNNVKHFVFDKTGTLTEDNLIIDRVDFPPFIQDIIYEITCTTGWTSCEIITALILANNQSNINERGEVWGFSPEENEILKYIVHRYKLVTLFNPLGDTGNLTFSIQDGKEKKVTISRNSYQHGKGKIADIELIGKNNYIFTVRQDGTHSIFNDYIPEEYREWRENTLTKINKRSIAISFTSGTYRYEVLSSFAFTNNLRPGVNTLMMFLNRKNYKCSILTGDGKDTSEKIASDSGFPIPIYPIIDTKDLLTIPKNCSISISGDLIEQNLSCPKILNLINNNKDNLIIYSASKTLKSSISKVIQRGVYIGDASNDSLAIRDSYIGICLKHGSDMCKKHADIIILTPYDLVSLLRSGGYIDMILLGSQKLLIDVCLFTSYVGGFMYVKLLQNNKKYIGKSILFEETYSTYHLVITSSIFYFFSLLPYISNNYQNYRKIDSNKLSLWCIYSQFIGFLLGYFIFSVFSFNNDILIINLFYLIKHTCFRNNFTLIGSHPFEPNELGFIVRIMDSVLFRIVLFIGLFYLL